MKKRLIVWGSTLLLAGLLALGSIAAHQTTPACPLTVACAEEGCTCPGC